MNAVDTLQQVRHKPKRTRSSLVPIGRWIRQYDRAGLRPDVLAGVTVAAFTIPEAMAYAAAAAMTAILVAIICFISWLLLGLTGIVILFVMEEKLPRWPSALIAVLASIALMSFTNLAERGVAITGAIPSGLPTPHITALFDLNLIRALLPLAFSVFMLSYVEGMSMARTFADKHHYKIDADQELLALGMSNLAVGIFQGFPIGGSMSRSAVNDKSGAQSPLAGGVAALSIAVVLLFFTGLFTNLPETILAAVVIVAVKGLFKTKALRHLYDVNRIEVWIALAVLFGVLLFGMLEGVLIGVIVSLLLLVNRAALPHTAVLGRIPGTNQFSDLERNPGNEQVPGVLVYRPDARLFYANAPVIREQLTQLVSALEPRPQLVVLDLAGSPGIDLSVADMLRDLQAELHENGPTLKLAEVSEPVRVLLKADGLAEKFGLIDEHQSVQQVIAAFAGSSPSASSGP